MQTDRFDETIRQKLDSIQPAYHESAWRTLQQTLLQHGIVSTGTALGGLLSTLTALTVAGLIGTTVYLYRSNTELRRQVSTLTQTVTRLEQQHLTAPKATATGPNRVDTVYMARPVPQESVSTVNTSSAARPTETKFGEPGIPQTTIRPQATGQQPTTDQSVTTSDPLTNRKPTYRQPADAVARRVPALTNERPDLPMQPAGQSISRKPSASPVQQSAVAVNQPAVSEPTQSAETSPARPAAEPDLTVGTNAVRTSPANTRRPTNLPTAPANRPVGKGSKRSNRALADQPAPTQLVADQATADRDDRDQRTVNRSKADQLATNRMETVARQRSRRAGNVTSDPIEPVTPSGQLNSANASAGQQPPIAPSMTQLANRPLQLSSLETGAGIARRVRRLRYLFPSVTAPAVAAAPVTEASAAQPESKRVSTATTVRLGVSGETDGLRTGGGFYVETRIGTHWTLGVGLNRLSQSGGSYTTDEEFNESTRSDFRRDYLPPGFDPKLDPKFGITNINVTRQSWQLPLSVGYRIPLNHGFALTPTVGLALALSAKEQVTFTFQRGPRDFGSGAINARVLPISWYNNASLSLAAEKSWGHFTVQAMPFLSFPTETMPNRLISSPYRINATTGGVRLRLLYSF